MEEVNISDEPATKEDIAMLAHVVGAVIFQTISLFKTFGSDPDKASEHFKMLASLHQKLGHLADQIEGAA